MVSDLDTGHMGFLLRLLLKLLVGVVTTHSPTVANCDDARSSSKTPSLLSSPSPSSLEDPTMTFKLCTIETPSFMFSLFNSFSGKRTYAASL
ncbi:hypothetical protein LWI28_007664 [Acer negundo]|uniref:Secreted protein n=1 Tax=Acer negundo TaxID=4023 RepID=A0AAD5IKZ0_ACENE|nr:hypothetical protein LWI28_007664 [Acer negundo]